MLLYVEQHCWYLINDSISWGFMVAGMLRGNLLKIGVDVEKRWDNVKERCLTGNFTYVIILN